jgi:L-fuconolactonase
MLDFPIVDTHLHVWDPDLLRYPWLDDVPLLNKPHLLPDYNRVTAFLEVERMIFVQCEADFSQFFAEAAWAARLAQDDPRLQGIVAWAPLEIGDAARPDLERLAAIPLVKGIRRIIQFEPDPEFCLRPKFVKGVQALAEYGLSFDICIAHFHMENTIKMARQCPDVRFMLDHIGKPDIKNGLLDPWRAHIRELAAMPNVWCKLSGLATEAKWNEWTRENLKPYIDHVLTCFGTERVAFGGDWPVLVQAGTYSGWVEALVWALEGLSDADLRKVFRDNAIAFYRLSP